MPSAISPSLAIANHRIPSVSYMSNPSNQFSGILDLVPNAIYAYSVARRLNSAYTGNLVRLRRDSDNAEQNFTYNASGDLDTIAVAAFLGVANGFIVTLYDQSGNGRDITQAVALAQPAYTPAAVNGHPVATFDNSGTYLSRAVGVAATPLSAFIVAKSANTNSRYVFSFGQDTSAFIQGFSGILWEWFNSGPAGRTTIGSISTVIYQAISFDQADSPLITAFVFGTSFSLTGGTFWGGMSPELIVWNGTLSAGQQTAIRANFTSYYNTP